MTHPRRSEPSDPFGSEGVLFDPQKVVGPYVVRCSPLMGYGRAGDSRAYMGTSLIRKRLAPETYSRSMPRVLGWSWGLGVFL